MSAIGVNIPGGKLGDLQIAPFQLDRTETTVKAYRDCVEDGACTRPREAPLCDYHLGRNGKHPVDCVSREQAEQYCRWVGKRLPTGAEWEWAARGREENRFYPWGDALPTCSRVNADFGLPRRGKRCGSDLLPVGSQPNNASRDGVLDLQGNVAEWTSDSFSGRPEVALVKGVAAMTPSSAEEFEASHKSYEETGTQSWGLGFRCAASRSGGTGN